MSDRYTKIVLTVIAAALLGHLAPYVMTGAQAQMGQSCGSRPDRPCFVAFSVLDKYGQYFEHCDIRKPCMQVVTAP